MHASKLFTFFFLAMQFFFTHCFFKSTQKRCCDATETFDFALHRLLIRNYNSFLLQLNFKIGNMEHTYQPCVAKTKAAFLEDRHFFSQSGLFENFSDCSDWMEKSRPSKKATFVL